MLNLINADKLLERINLLFHSKEIYGVDEIRFIILDMMKSQPLQPNKLDELIDAYDKIYGGTATRVLREISNQLKQLRGKCD